MSWSLRFAEPILLADGVKLATLRQAIAAPRQLAHLHGAEIEVGEGPTPPQREEPMQ